MAAATNSEVPSRSPSITPSSSDGSLDLGLHMFILSSQFRVPICRQCKHGVWPRQIQAHCQGRSHRWNRARSIQIQTEICQWPNIIHEINQLPGIDPKPPIDPQLRVYNNGFKCIAQTDQCEFICCTEKTMKNHLTQNHPNIRGKRGARTKLQRQQPRKKWWCSVVCQRLFIQGPGSHYFEVQPPPSITNPESIPIPQSQIDRARIQLEEFWKKVEEKEKKKIQLGDQHEPNPWLERTGWERYLQGFDRSHYLK